MPSSSPTATRKRQIRSRFDGDTEQYLKTLHGQKLTQEQLQKKIAARFKQTEQLYRATAQAAEASDEDLKTYYNLIRDQLTPPDLRKTRHIFLATLNREEAQVRQTAETLLERLKAGESFSRLAREFSEDERSAPAGGELGWINPARAKETLGLADVPDDKPALLKSRWGWHLVEASPVKKGKTPSYEEALPALRDATRSLRKAQAVGLYMDGLFEEAHLRNRIKNKQGR